MKLTIWTTFLLVATWTLVATAQRQPDASCWQGDPNPDGSQVVPVLNYSSDTGIFSINTLGLNQVLDTTEQGTIGGDDVGLISFSIVSPEPSEFLLDGFVDGVVWNTQYFNGKSQVFGVGAGSEFLLPAENTDLFRFPVGTGVSGFGLAEVAINFETGRPGGIIFGGCLVPEPATGGLAVFVMTMLMLSRRRRERHFAA